MPINHNQSQKRVSAINIEQGKTPNKKQINSSKSNQQKSNLRSQQKNRQSANNQLKVSNLFEGLTFMIEVYENQESKAQYIIPRIENNGGIIVSEVLPITSYLVFENGRENIIKKILRDPQYKNVKVISPFWIQQSLNSKQLQDHNDFKPYNLENFHSPLKINSHSQKFNSSNASRSKKQDQLQNVNISNFMDNDIDEENSQLQRYSPIRKSNRIQKRESPLQISEEKEIIEDAKPKSKRQAKIDTKSKTVQQKIKKDSQGVSLNKKSNQQRKDLKQQTLNMAVTTNSQINRTIQMLDSSPLMEKEEIEKTFQQIKEEVYFKKEFEKELKRFNKMALSLQRDILPNSQLQQVNNQNDTTFDHDNKQSQLEISQNEIKHEQIHQKRETRYLTKNQLIESYIEGDIELVDFIDHMVPKLNNKKKQGHHGNQHRKNDINNKRISEMYQRKNNQDRSMVDEDQQNNLDITQDQQSFIGQQNQQINKSALVSLNDYLFDIDKENTPAFEINKIKDNTQSSLKQTNLFSMGLSLQPKEKQGVQSQQILKNDNLNIFNCKPLSIFSGLTNERITKSYTMVKNALQTIQESPKFGKLNKSPQSNHKLEFNKSIIKRAKSLTPMFSYSQSISLPSFGEQEYYHQQRAITKRRDFNQGIQYLQMNDNDELNDMNISFNITQLKGKQRQHNNNETKNKPRPKTDWSKILPQRKMPSRGCKLNISYVEDQDEKDERNIFKRRILFNR